MTTQFETAAALMARILGADGYEFVSIEHPLSSASTAVLGERAGIAATEIAALLTMPQPVSKR